MRNRICSWTFFGFAAALVIGCGPQLRLPTVSPSLVQGERQRQKEEVLKLYFERAEQVARVSHSLRTKGSQLCQDNLEPVLGLFWADKKIIPEEYWDVGERVFGLGEDLRVLSVMPGSPADLAGVKPGDVVIKISGQEVVPGLKLYSKISKSEEAQELLRRATTKSVDLEIERAASRIQIAVEPIPGCGFPSRVNIDDRVNAFADGKNIIVTTGLLRFVRDDDELSIVLGHEMAHNTLDHASRSNIGARTGWVLGLILDAAAMAGGVSTGGIFSQWGAQAGRLIFSKDYESEADYLGLYFAVNGGFDIFKAPDLWRRMAAEHPGSIKENFLSTHPSSPERTASISAALQEIKMKLKSQSPLTPERKEKSAPLPPAGDGIKSEEE